VYAVYFQWNTFKTTHAWNMTDYSNNLFGFMRYISATDK
jgi:hypothetical protein